MREIMRKFRITYTSEIEVELDKKVIDVVDDEWRSVFYNLFTPEDIAEHIGMNMADGLILTQLDGFADLENGMARIVTNDTYDVEVEEIKDKNV
jgi:hypothetical protein